MKQLGNVNEVVVGMTSDETEIWVGNTYEPYESNCCIPISDWQKVKEVIDEAIRNRATKEHPGDRQ